MKDLNDSQDIGMNIGIINAGIKPYSEMKAITS